MEATLAAPVPLIWIISGQGRLEHLHRRDQRRRNSRHRDLWFRTGISVANLGSSSFATVATYISLSSFGLMLSTIYVLSRKGGFIMNSLEVPVYIATGTMFPVALLPLVTQPIAFILGPTWGIDAIRKAAIAGYTGIGHELLDGYSHPRARDGGVLRHLVLPLRPGREARQGERDAGGVLGWSRRRASEGGSRWRCRSSPLR